MITKKEFHAASHYIQRHPKAADPAYALALILRLTGGEKPLSRKDVALALDAEQAKQEQDADNRRKGKAQRTDAEKQEALLNLPLDAEIHEGETDVLTDEAD